ncbi:MAG: hypothetical protein LBL09_02735 [Oscillospiraceae bacterium]|nr:hypothetical protein [Oscillospiraceae bacterium]
MLIWAIIGLFLFVHITFSAGFSFFAPAAITTEAELEAFYAGSGPAYRPFARVGFDEVSFSGLYLYAENEDLPTDWIMYGSLGDKWLIFFQKARDPEAPPEYMENVGYIIRYPSDENAVQTTWARDTIISDIVNEFGLEEGEVEPIFHKAVMQADRNGMTVSRITFAASILLTVFSLVMFFGKGKKARAAEPADGGKPV